MNADARGLLRQSLNSLPTFRKKSVSVYCTTRSHILIIDCVSSTTSVHKAE